jgi:hypothetical protein
VTKRLLIVSMKCDNDLIPECSGFMGAAAMIQSIMEGDCKVLTF